MCEVNHQVGDNITCTYDLILLCIYHDHISYGFQIKISYMLKI